ncbi:hypothetical protein EZV62_006231 [Acer yangbiense]|uniref:Disease resistance protein At4g27190-like leucine-rich repeats domain-containing protein n=1 Tax=Acer yangbiense TaxID=1000413 RepID=A0A5C7IS58_9ROSI|nr:hypothetical protein EZV62_006231 [Acer yangbiense]
MLGRLQRLEILEVQNCDSVEEIFELEALSSKKTHAIAAAQLRTLQIHYLPKLKHVWNVDSQVILSYQNLHSISVQYCVSLKSLFPASVARGLVQLEEHTIHYCCMMKEITAKDDTVEVKAVLRMAMVLKTLDVQCCNELDILASQVLSHGESRHEIPTGQPLFLMVGLLNIMKLSIEEIDNLRKIWYDQLYLDSFSKLEQVYVYGCNNLLNVFPSNMLGRLQRLGILEVENYDSVEEIFELEALGSKKTHAIAAAKLRTLQIVI